MEARVEQVQSPRLADSGGELDYRVRAGYFADKAAGANLPAQITAAGYSSSGLYTGWDRDLGSIGTTHGPWNLDVITIDPKNYHGELRASFGADLEKPETTSQLAAASGAVANINAGFFVFDPKAGAAGDPASDGVYEGRTLSEPAADRPAWIIGGKSHTTQIQRLRWAGSVAAWRTTLALDGIDRVTGLIRNCGERNGAPTALPLQDVTCTNANELVAFDSALGRRTPAGPGFEVSLSRRNVVTAVTASRGSSVPVDGHTLQATGHRRPRPACGGPDRGQAGDQDRSSRKSWQAGQTDEDHEHCQRRSAADQKWC
ncbi:hypothetical protein IV498_17770 [Paenarthrobacter sp. Z7-10]|uniref:hypothetical protein n=1 Tax=Paenarthrobacter sp. Z7-10 TaxID=2787635 RepID=UPI0022A9BB53|nr:hypothetical protein [Paenarthrobacter sp. Z7-10]MCZ2404958.1 hypothetical protein [Paenarthrobacter sp. Z7-10]